MYRYKVNSDLAANQSKGPSSSFFGYFTFYILLRICLKAKPSHEDREVLVGREVARLLQQQDTFCSTFQMTQIFHWPASLLTDLPDGEGGQCQWQPWFR